MDTVNRLNVVHRETIQLEHFRRLGFFLPVAAHCKRILRDLNQNKITFLPLFPHLFALSSQVAAVLHILWLVHANDDLDGQVLVSSILGHDHFVPLGRFAHSGDGFDDNFAQFFVI